MNLIVRPDIPIPAPRKIKMVAYGDLRLTVHHPPDIRMGRLYRLERGFPYARQANKNNPVFATPQFRALTLYTHTTKNAQIPGATVTPGSITYPTLAKL